MLYKLTKRLGKALSLPLTLHHTLAPSLEQRKKGDPQSHKHDNVPPEAVLTAAAILVLKMVYGLDGDNR
jgi:RNA polymerase I-specific transcription initiation factor RRN7